MDLLFYMMTIITSFAISTITTHFVLRYRANKLKKAINKEWDAIKQVLDVLQNRQSKKT